MRSRQCLARAAAIALALASFTACQASTSEIEALPSTSAEPTAVPAATSTSIPDQPDATGAATPPPTPDEPEAATVDDAIDAGIVARAASTVFALISRADFADSDIADLDRCPSATIEDTLRTSVPDRVDDEILPQAARWTIGADVACIVTTAAGDDGFDNSAAIAAYRSAVDFADYLEDVAYYGIDDRSTVRPTTSDLGPTLGGSLHNACVVYDEPDEVPYGYCEVAWVHPEGLVITHWTTVIDDLDLLSTMQDTLVEALPAIIDDLASLG